MSANAPRSWPTASLLLLLIGLRILLASQPAQAQLGTVLADFVPGGATGNEGRGIAFDGTNLYYTIVDGPNIYKVTTTGTLLATIPVAGGLSRGGPLAWDGSALWTMDYSVGSFTLYRVNPADGSILSSCNIATQNPAHPAVTSSPRNIGELPDGLDWSGSTLWVSSEAFSGNWVVEVDTSCNILTAFNPPANLGTGTCADAAGGTSGIAFVGGKLWHPTPTNDCTDMLIFETDTSGVPTGLSFVADRLTEDLAFDPVTFAPNCALWGNEATFFGEVNHLTAYEIPCPANGSPVAECKNVTVPTDPGMCSSASASVDDGSFDPDGDTITLAQSPSGPYGLGSTSVTLTATDPAGLSSTCTATVTVVDEERPAITCPLPQTVECTGPNGANVSVNATATDNCSVAQLICAPGSGTFPIGSTPVTCTATDSSKNSNSCTTEVVVADTRPPAVSCVQSVNPSGKNVPAASRTNEDGFYKVSASDVCTAASAIKITIGSYTLANGETIKITQSPGQSGVTLVNVMGPLQIRHFRVGPGDAVIKATDAANNMATVTCLVPPPPK